MAGHGIKYSKYDFEYEDFFRLDKTTAQNRIDDLVLSVPQQRAPQDRNKTSRILSTTWARLKIQ